MDLIFALAFAVDLNADNVKDIEKHMAESLKRPGKAITLQTFQFLFSPRL